MKKYLLLLLLSGCAVTNQVATTSETNPVTGITTTQVARTKTFNLLDSHISVDKTRASAGKTASVGSTGTDANASSTNLAANLNALSQLLNSLR